MLSSIPVTATQVVAEPTATILGEYREYPNIRRGRVLNVVMQAGSSWDIFLDVGYLGAVITSPVGRPGGWYSLLPRAWSPFAETPGRPKPCVH